MPGERGEFELRFSYENACKFVVTKPALASAHGLPSRGAFAASSSLADSSPLTLVFPRVDDDNAADDVLDFSHAAAFVVAFGRAH